MNETKEIKELLEKGLPDASEDRDKYISEVSDQAIKIITANEELEIAKLELEEKYETLSGEKAGLLENLETLKTETAESEAKAKEEAEAKDQEIADLKAKIETLEGGYKALNAEYSEHLVDLIVKNRVSLMGEDKIDAKALTETLSKENVDKLKTRLEEQGLFIKSSKFSIKFEKEDEKLPELTIDKEDNSDSKTDDQKPEKPIIWKRASKETGHDQKV